MSDDFEKERERQHKNTTSVPKPAPKNLPQIPSNAELQKGTKARLNRESMTPPTDKAFNDIEQAQTARRAKTAAKYAGMPKGGF